VPRLNASEVSPIKMHTSDYNLLYIAHLIKNCRKSVTDSILLKMERKMDAL